MRKDNKLFETDNKLGSKEARYVVSIDFDGTVQYFTSHDDIANVPGTPIQSVLIGISATSQTLNPDRANATIGSMSFDILDLNEAFTDLVRTELATNDVGLRGRTCTFHIGYKTDQIGAGVIAPGSTDDNPDFDNFALFQTQIVQSVESKEGRYSIKCADIQRETKKQIFELALTYLTNSISDSTTTIPVLDLSGFEGNNHGTSYTDAPSSNVIYIEIDQTKEIIRCPVADIVGNSFTNVTRGALQTKAKAVEVDQTQASDRRPKVEEYVYLELPAVKLAYAILTGVIEGTGDVLPSNWHANVPTAFVRLSDFQNIGADLWVTGDDTAGVIPRFDGINKQDAKRFLETEIYLLIGLFSPVYADGQLGLKRMVPSLSDSPFSFEVNDNNVIGTSTLKHDMESMQNNLRIDWNWNGDRYIRSTIVVDSASIARHGQAPEKRLRFRGLVGTRFTEQVLRQLLTSLRDMYTGPPLRLDVNGFHLMNPLEVGDACRVNLSHIRDYSQPGSNLNRTMVVHGMSVDWLAGVKLKLFGSSERADEIPPIVSAQCLLDAFYPQEGTALSSIPGLMTGNVTNAGTFTLSGSGDMNAVASIFYHDAPLTISSTTTLIIEDNVQLRVRGFLTIDGLIDGTAKGLLPGVSLFDFDQHYYWLADKNVGVPGFIGNNQSHFGLLFREPDDGGFPNWVWVTAGYFTEGLHQAFPNLILEVSDSGSGSIIGIPADMRGGGGAAGPRAGLKIGLSGRTHQKADGGAGGRGGGALCIVCRGGDFGVSGQITLDGDDSVSPSSFFNPAAIYNIYGGAGGAGAPGALLWLIDGSAQTFPDLAGHFQAKTGIVPSPFALPFLDGPGQNRSLSQTNAPTNVQAPFMPGRISGFDQSGVNFRISFLPCDVIPEDDQDTIVSAPTSPSVTPVVGGVRLAWTNTNQDRSDVLTEIYLADEDVRGSALLIATVAGEIYYDLSGDVQRKRYFWFRAIDANGNVSAFEPDTTTTTIIASPFEGQPLIIPDPFIRQGASVWDFSESTGGSQTYEIGAGTDSDAIRVTQPAPTGFWRMIGASRRGPDEWDLQPGSEFTIEVRWRWALQNTPGGSHSFALSGFVVVEDEDGSNLVIYKKLGTKFITESSTVGEWVDDSAIVVVKDTGTQPRYVRAGVELSAIAFANTRYDIDRVDAILQTREFDGTNKPGLVPQAGAGDSGLFLQGDGTWGTPTGSGVDSFNSRTGAVLPILADYNSFFLTPAEGDAAYSMLGHAHVLADITDSGALAALNTVGTSEIDNDAVTYGKIQNVVADDRILGNIAGVGAIVAELTAAQVRTMINVENAATADQTAGEIEAIVNHDNLQGVSAAQHVDWAVTGAENLHANRFGAGANFVDTDLNRALIEDYAITHQALTISSNAATLDFESGNSALIDLQPATGDVTLTLSNPPASGRRGEASLIVVQGSTPRDIIWPGSITWLFGGLAPTFSNVDNAVHEVHLFTTDGGVNYYGTFASPDAATVPQSLIDLSDVNSATPTNLNALMADGVDWESRALTAADIQSAEFANARIAVGNVTQHEAAIDHDALLGFVGQEHIRWDLSGAEDIHSSRFANAPVQTVFGRSGAVVALQADYDGFFLTPAEGDAAYSLLGHSHVPADITFAATNRFLGRDTAGGGAGEEITAAAARTILNVEDGSTADQTAAQIEAIVDHDNLLGFLGAEHVNWAASGAENIETNRFAAASFTGTVNLQDNLLSRPHIGDFAVKHQVVTGVASTTINYTLGQSVLLNLSAANITTLTINNWPATGRLGQMEIEVTQGATPRTIAWDTVIAGTVGWPDGVEPDLNVANGRFLINLRSRDGKTTLIGTFAEDFG